MYISVKRVCESNAPLELVVEAGNDWTHFTHLHRKSHLAFQLLYKSGHREIFFYKARILYPLPFYTPYIVFREYVPERQCYDQIYQDLRSGRVHYLSGSHASLGDTVLGTGEFWFSVSSFWRYCPRLFFWLFKRRMRGVMEEDNRMIRERMRLGLASHAECDPRVPESYDLYADLMGKGLPEAEFTFSDHVFTDLRRDP